MGIYIGDAPKSSLFSERLYFVYLYLEEYILNDDTIYDIQKLLEQINSRLRSPDDMKTCVSYSRQIVRNEIFKLDEGEYFIRNLSSYKFSVLRTKRYFDISITSIDGEPVNSICINIEEDSPSFREILDTYIDIAISRLISSIAISNNFAAYIAPSNLEMVDESSRIINAIQKRRSIREKSRLIEKKYLKHE